MQTLHYLTLSLLIPPLLSLFADPISLNYEGGPANVGQSLRLFLLPPILPPKKIITGMIMDWREMAGRPTVRGIYGGERWTSYTQWAWSGGKKVGYGWKEDRWDGRTDPLRGWIIAGCWLLACSAEYVPPSLPSSSHSSLTKRKKQHLLLIHPNPPPPTHPRLRTHPSIQPSSTNDVLLRLPTHLFLFLARLVGWVGGDGGGS